jgi:hypothetical protein
VKVERKRLWRRNLKKNDGGKVAGAAATIGGVDGPAEPSRSMKLSEEDVMITLK